MVGLATMFEARLADAERYRHAADRILGAGGRRGIVAFSLKILLGVVGCRIGGMIHCGTSFFAQPKGGHRPGLTSDPLGIRPDSHAAGDSATVFGGASAA